MIELRGKPVADNHKDKLAEQIKILEARGQNITMAIVVVGEDKASKMYASFMKRVAEKNGFIAKTYEMPEDATQAAVEELIITLSKDEEIDGILPMMPMPKHIDTKKVLDVLNPEKDLDGLTVTNIGLVASNQGGFTPCTPLACMAILDYYDIELEGKNVVVLGRSNVVGKPVANLLLARNATVTICHSRTKNIKEITATADIIISAIGKAHFVTADMVKEGAVVIDVGINDLDGETVGDVDYAKVSANASAMTPVPGGVGSVTTTMMLEALFRAHKI